MESVLMYEEALDTVQDCKGEFLMKSEIVLFMDGDTNIEVQINPEQETVWLTQKQMEVLFDVKHATISEHITNILASGEMNSPT